MRPKVIRPLSAERDVDGAVKRTYTDLSGIPQIVCLCGSTRFKDEYRAENKRLTIEGNIVLSVGFFGHSDGWDGTLDDGTKEMLDELHKRKIDVADRVHVINAEGYVGDSTENEIVHAVMTNTPVTWYDEDQIPERFSEVR